MVIINSRKTCKWMWKSAYASLNRILTQPQHSPSTLTRYQKKGENSTCTAEKSGRQAFNQAVQANITKKRTKWHHVTLDRMHGELHTISSPTQNVWPESIPNWESLHKRPSLHSAKISVAQKTKLRHCSKGKKTKDIGRPNKTYDLGFALAIADIIRSKIWLNAAEETTVPYQRVFHDLDNWTAVT